MASLWPFSAWRAAADGGQATPAEQLTVLPGFKVQLLRSAATNEGSWICMAVDPKGRFYISPQEDSLPMLRVTVDKEGQVEKIEPVPAPLHQAMGLCYAHGSLYVDGHGPDGTGLYRLIDLNHDDQFESNEVRFLKKIGGEGEHGYHAVIEGPDKDMYIVSGNFTQIPDGLESTSPHRNYSEDFLLPRAWDGNGFAVGLLAPGGWVARTDPEGHKWQLMLAGMRNTYDIAFNKDGELFGFDSDMEWDWGLPWYRPTRIIHAVPGAEFGWRSGSAKEPPYYEDSLPPALNVGLGSPTGVEFGTDSNFPRKYREALFAEDWAYGRLFAMHITPHGSTYTAEPEVFIRGKPLNMTSLQFGRDGAMYFITGGRGIQSGLYRVTFVGDRAMRKEMDVVPPRDRSAAHARAERHKLEYYGENFDPRAVKKAWPFLHSDDRFLRDAARLAIERQLVWTWRDRALSETDPMAGLTALLALARCDDKLRQPELLQALEKFRWDSLTDEERLIKLRVLELSFVRQGRPPEATEASLVAELDPLFPGPSEPANRELVQLLIYLHAPDVITKAMDQMAKGQTQEDQIFYLFHLRTVDKGWTLEQRRRYFAWFTDFRQNGTSGKHPAQLVQWFKDVDRDYTDGSSFDKYLVNLRKDAIDTLSSSEEAALGPLTKASIGAPPWKAIKTHPMVKEWTVADLAGRLQEVTNRVNHKDDLETGRMVFNDAQCVICHRLANEGGSVGPELGGAGNKYSPHDLLESIIEPSKVISDQFVTYNIVKKNGDTVSGRITDQNADRIVLMPDPMSAATLVEVPLNDIASRTASKISPMPTDLVDHFTQDEILDLLAYIEAGGKTDVKEAKEDKEKK